MATLKVKRFISIGGAPAKPWSDMTPEEEQRIKHQLALNLIQATQDYYNRHPEELLAFERGCRELDEKRKCEKEDKNESNKETRRT